MATKKMAIIASKGALDMAYPPLILASTAASLGWDVKVFFTFYGLQLLRKDLSGIAISPLATRPCRCPCRCRWSSRCSRAWRRWPPA
jgi:peroxiredoxin family protein